MYRWTRNKSHLINEHKSEAFTAFKRIAQTRTPASVGGVKVDPVTATAVVTAHGKLSDTHAQSLAAMPAEALAQFGQSLIKKGMHQEAVNECFSELIGEEEEEDEDVLHSTLHLYESHGHKDRELMEASIESLWEARKNLKDVEGSHGLTYNQAAKIAGGGTTSGKNAGKQISPLSKPSKMPGFAYALPAKRCQMGAILHKMAKQQGKPTTCGDCYALKGRYIFPNVADAAERRFATLDHPEWSNAMATVIKHHARTDKKGKDYGHAHFRWHDSGDLQSPEHLGNIMDVARMTDGSDGGPEVHHWLPTREYGHVQEYLKSKGMGDILNSETVERAKSAGVIPHNMNIRFSGHIKDAAPPRSKGLTTSSVSTVKKDELQGFSGDTSPKGIAKSIAKARPDNSLARDIRDHDAYACPAPRQGGECGKCRACWDHDTGHVIYHEH